MTHLDLFSGIGGFALAAKWRGFDTIAFCEKDEFCQKVLKKHWPNVPIFGDIKEFDGEQFNGKVDLLTGGYPCQPFSTAGKRKGQDDPRHLWPEMFRVIKQARPAWVLCENVAGHITCGLDEVWDDLEGEGYACQPVVIPACAVNAPHIRSRVWIVANLYRRGWDTQPQSHKSFTTNQKDNIDADSSGASERRQGAWPPEPRMGRVVDGVSRRVDKPRLKALGNAIVPQVAYEILRCIRDV